MKHPKDRYQRRLLSEKKKQFSRENQQRLSKEGQEQQYKVRHKQFSNENKQHTKPKEAEDGEQQDTALGRKSQRFNSSVSLSNKDLTF